LTTLWHNFGNPVFPLLNDIFRSPYYDAVSLRDARFSAHDLIHLIGYPFYWMKTNIYLVSELPTRDWRGGIAYFVAAAGLSMRIASLMRQKPREHEVIAETRGLNLLLAFVAVSYLVWAGGVGIYRYAVVLEMLTGVVAMASLIWLFEKHLLRLGATLVMLIIVIVTTVYPDWGHGEHPSAGMRPAAYGERYLDVRVPALPPDSIVLIATENPVAYIIPFAEPTARYLGIENSFLRLSQSNKLTKEIRRLMRTPGIPKFVVTVDGDDNGTLEHLLEEFNLEPDVSSCKRIRSNLEEEVLSLCPLAPKAGACMRLLLARR
jgi:hypothetical protein